MPPNRMVLRVVESESVPPGRIVFMPTLKPRPGETAEQVRRRVVAATVVVDGVAAVDRTLVEEPS